jgi:hypothetical protein
MGNDSILIPIPVNHWSKPSASSFLLPKGLLRLPSSIVNEIPIDVVKTNGLTHHIEHIDLNSDHTSYLIARHGTTQLDPLPSTNPLNPLNWPKWRKNVYLGIFA